MSPADVAVYGGLCALASFDRPELKSRVLDNIGFREFLEAAPQARNQFRTLHCDNHTLISRCNGLYGTHHVCRACTSVRYLSALRRACTLQGTLRISID